MEDDMGELDLKKEFSHVFELFDFLGRQLSDTLWICNGDYSKQIYVSPQFETVWGRNCHELYNDIDVFRASIFEEDISKIYPVYNERFFTSNCPPAIFRIHQPNGQVKFIKDICVNLYNDNGKKIAAMGLGKNISEAEWEENQDHSKKRKIIDNVDNDLFLAIASSLKLNLSVTLENKENKDDYFICVNDVFIRLTRREATCVYYLVQGYTGKLIAKKLSLSPRTVETHLINIKNKAECNRAIELIRKIKNINDIEQWQF